MRPYWTRSRLTIPGEQGPQSNSISKVFSAISPLLKISIRSFSTSEASSARNRRCGRKNAPRNWEDSDETSRLNKVDRRFWSGKFDDEPAADDLRAGTGQIGVQGVRRPASRLSNRGGDRESGQETRSRHQRAAL